MSRLVTAALVLFFSGLLLSFTGLYIILIPFLFTSADEVIHGVNSPYDAVVLGTGMGSLATSAKLSLSGARVLHIQLSERLGGCATPVEMQDSSGENWLSDVNAAVLNDALYPRGLLDVLSDEFGLSRDEFTENRKTWVNIVGGNSLGFTPDNKEWNREVRHLCGSSYRCESEVQRIKERAVRVYDQFTAIADFDSQGWLEKIKNTAFFSYLHFETFISNLFPVRFFLPSERNGELASLLTAHTYCTEGLRADDLSSWTYLLRIGSALGEGGGSCYPTQGCDWLATELGDRIRDGNGHILMEEQVEKIIVENLVVGGVRLANGTNIPSSVVISDLSMQEVVNLIGREKLYAYYLEAIDLMKRAPSAAILDFKVKDTEEIRRIFRGYTSVHTSDDSINARSGGEKLCSLSISITNMSALSPSFCREGYSILRILSISNRESWISAQEQSTQEEIEEKFIECVRSNLEKLPGWDITIDSGSYVIYNPLQLEKLLNLNSSLFGIARTQRTNILSSQRLASPVKGLFFASDEVFPGLFVRSVVLSGLMAAETVLAGKNIVDLPYGFYVGLFMGFIGTICLCLAVLITLIRLVQRLSDRVLKLLPDVFSSLLTFFSEEHIVSKDKVKDE